jgi:hypothetical protein
LRRVLILAAFMFALLIAINLLLQWPDTGLRSSCTQDNRLCCIQILG